LPQRRGNWNELKRTLCARTAVFLACFVFSFPACAFDDAESNPVGAEAQRELFAARYDKAVTLYTRLLTEQPPATDAWYGLVRAELGLRQSREAYAAAEEALRKAPQSAGAQTAAGLAMYRRGDLAKAEAHFRTALKIKPDYPGALVGLASVFSSVSMFKSARDLRLKAYSQSPNDPELMAVYANTLSGSELIAKLEAALALCDPSSEKARNLGVLIANLRAAGQRKLRRLTSTYEDGHVKLFRIMDGPSRPRGVGVSLRFNGKQTAKLLLDTGASGIALSPRLAEKAGLQVISGETSETSGIGDGKAQMSVAYLASEVRAGNVVFADYPVSVFRSAQTADFDGLIGADVFEQFLVKIDFVQMTMSLEARPEGAAQASDELMDWNGKPAPGFYRVFRFGDHLAVPTFINGDHSGAHSALFLIDSGSSSNLIDAETAREFTKVRSDSRTVIKGIQGKVGEASRADRISLIFAGFRQDNPDLIAIDLEKLNDSMGVGFGGILGMPVLGNLAVTIDYRKGAVKFDYRKP
jgi:tetratricopeptide (TPR) repeat protein